MRIDREKTEAFRRYLQERECSAATVAKYLHDVGLLAAFCGGEIGDKGTLIAFKQHLQERGYAPSSVNSMLAAVNRFLEFVGLPQWKLRYLKAPRSTFCGREKELTQQDYERLVRAARAQRSERPALLLQTICATGYG